MQAAIVAVLLVSYVAFFAWWVYKALSQGDPFAWGMSIGLTLALPIAVLFAWRRHPKRRPPERANRT